MPTRDEQACDESATCICDDILRRDATRHFKECPCRVLHPEPGVTMEQHVDEPRVERDRRERAVRVEESVKRLRALWPYASQRRGLFTVEHVLSWGDEVGPDLSPQNLHQLTLARLYQRALAALREHRERLSEKPRVVVHTPECPWQPGCDDLCACTPETS